MTLGSSMRFLPDNFYHHLFFKSAANKIQSFKIMVSFKFM
jgi:hypothetical protein